MSRQVDRCPKCGAALAGDAGTVRWCRECNWNVDPLTVPRHDEYTRREASNIRRAQRIHEQALAGRLQRPSDRRAIVLLALLLLPFLVLHLALAGAAVAAFVTTTSWWWRVVVCLPLLALAALPWLLTLRSREGGAPLDRETCPHLFGGVAALAAELKMPPPSKIRVNWSNTTSINFGARDWELCLGVPLWMTMSPVERAATVANRTEAARHYSSMGGVVRRTADLFEQAYNVGGRVDSWIREPKQVGPWSPLRLPFNAYLRAKGRLMFDSNIRLSYWCDRSAADAVSAEAMAGCLAVMHSGAPRAAGRFQRHGVNEVFDPTATLLSLSEPLPPSERERWARAAMLNRTIDPEDGRPPTGHRIEVLRARPSNVAVVHRPGFEADGRFAAAVIALIGD